MRKIALTCFFSLALTNVSFAVLPPLYQGISEIKTLLEDKRLDKYLEAGDVITSIEKTGHGYKIVTNHRVLPVTIYYLPAEHPGPAKFTVEFEPAALKSGAQQQ